MTAQKDASLSGVRDVSAPKVPLFSLDETDLAILQVLVVDARVSQRQLAATLGISAPTVAERMARLEREGVISGYVAAVNWDAVGFSQVVYLSITATAGYDVSEIMGKLWLIPEVEEVILVTGDLDLLVKLRVRDYTHLRSLLMDHLWQISGTQGTSTLLSMAEMPAKNFASGLLNQMQADSEAKGS